jgi:protoheme IX farnesyltransferase
MSVAVRADSAVESPSLFRALRDLNSLTKPRIIVLLELTTLAAMIMAARGMPPLGTTIATLAGGWLMAAGANTVNCWWDRDIDLAMARTRRRPLPAGRIDPAAALALGTGLAAVAFLLLALTVNLTAALLALAGLLFYVLVYTMWLKRSTSQNIVIGGAAGAIPPMVGWAAATGHIGPTALFLFAVIFYWTPPHFWALALLIRSDYATAGVPMLPVVAGDRRTREQIVLYTVLLIVVTVLPLLAGSFGLVYAGGAGLLDAGLLAQSVVAVRSRSARSARRLYYYSIVYLALIFAVMAVDRVVGGLG